MPRVPDTGSVKFASGVVSDDPLQTIMSEGVNFRSVSFQGSDANQQPQSAVNWDYFNGAIAGLVLKSKDSSNLIGTAVIIAPGLAITATHNLSDILDELKTGSAIPYCFGLRPNALDVWKVAKTTFTDSDDITFLSLEAASQIPEDRTYYQFGITTRTPKNGEELHIIGFRSEGVLFTSTNGDSFAANLYLSRGEVTAVYRNGRDKMLIPYPAIELNCGSLGGMSGGAAVDKNGLLVGIISRGMSTAAGDGPTYVSWIIGSLGRNIELCWPSGLHQTPLTPLTIDKRLIHIDKREALDGSTETKMKYKIWFE